MTRAFPGAPVHTSLYDPDGTFPEFADVDVRPALLNRVAPLRRRHRAALPVLATTFSAMKVDAEVTICSSSGWAHGARTTGHKIVYCHAPARWLYQSDRYLARRGGVTTSAFRALAPTLKSWDRRAAATADAYLANSRHTAGMIEGAYGIAAEVLTPPIGLTPDGERRAVAGLHGRFSLCVSRLLPYKNVDVLLDAYARRPTEQLVVVGSGPLETELRARAARNVRFLGEIDDAQLRWLYDNASELVAASYEDFGLTPAEAAVFGLPSVVLHFGGYLETVADGETGVFVDELTPDAFLHGLDRSRALALEPAAIARHGQRFSEAAFADGLARFVDGSDGH